MNSGHPQTNERKKKRGSRRIKKKSYGDIIGNDQFCTVDIFFFFDLVRSRRNNKKKRRKSGGKSFGSYIWVVGLGWRVHAPPWLSWGGPERPVHFRIRRGPSSSSRSWSRAALWGVSLTSSHSRGFTLGLKAAGGGRWGEEEKCEKEMILLRDYRVKVYRRLVVPAAAAGQDSIHGRLMPPIPNPIARLWQRQTYSLFSLFHREIAPPSLSTTSRSRNNNKKIPYVNRRRQNGIIVVVGLVRNLWPPPPIIGFRQSPTPPTQMSSATADEFRRSNSPFVKYPHTHNRLCVMTLSRRSTFGNCQALIQFRPDSSPPPKNNNNKELMSFPPLEISFAFSKVSRLTT